MITIENSPTESATETVSPEVDAKRLKRNAAQRKWMRKRKTWVPKDGFRFCAVCRRELPESEFQNAKSCPSCLDRQRKYWDAMMADPVKAEAYRRRKQEYLKTNSEKISARQKDYREKNRAKVLAIEKASKAKRDMDKWYIWSRNNRNRRLSTDIQFRMEIKYRTKIRNKIARGKRGGSFSKLEILGCDWPTLKAYLESKFLPDMSWDNHGMLGRGSDRVWHIDHIIPVKAFDLTNYEEAKKAFHYTNMQPMWALDNIAKSDTIPPLIFDATSIAA